MEPKQVAQKGMAPVRRGPLEALLPTAKSLKALGLMVSIMPHGMTKMIDLAMIQLQWLYRLAGVSGGELEGRPYVCVTPYHHHHDIDDVHQSYQGYADLWWSN